MFSDREKDKDYFIENLSVLINSNINISEALDIIYSGVKNNNFKKKVSFIKDQIDSGFYFWESLEKTKMFPLKDISLIKIGEQSGHLSENLKILSDQYQKEKVFRSKVFSALLYPAIILFMVIIIGFGMSWFLLPKLAMIFSQLDIELPQMTKIMISIGFFVQSYGAVFFPLTFSLIVILFYLFFINKKTKFIGQSILFNFFVTKKIILEAELSRLGFILGVLLEAGFNIKGAFKTMEESSTFWFYKKIYGDLSNSLSEGISLKESISSYKKIDKYIPLPIQQIIFVGEKSGKLSESFFVIGKRYEEKLDISTKNLTVALEPLLLIIVWLGVVFLALSIIMPVYNLIGQIN